MKCAYCNGEVAIVEGNPEFSIHRDGFGDGPEVPLCREHGQHYAPTCEEIWKRIAERIAAGEKIETL